MFQPPPGSPFPTLPPSRVPGGITPRRRRLIWLGVGVALAGAVAILVVSYRRTAEDLRRLVDAAALRHGLDPRLVAAVVEAESGGNPRAVSRARAYGLMQLRIATATEVARRPITIDDLFDPRVNLDLGCRYLRRMLDWYDGDRRLALMAYNAGPGTLNRWLESGDDTERILDDHAYPATRKYVRRVLALAGRR